MSTIVDVDLECTCGHVMVTRRVNGLHGSREPALRDAAKRGVLHRYTCPLCGVVTAVERRFVYTDIPRGHYVAVEPPGADAAAAYRRHVRVFEDAFYGTSPIAADIGDRVTLRRLVFGADALREKLVIWDHGLDDYVIEALKGDLLATAGPGLDAADVRFAARSGDLLWFSCIAPGEDLGRFAVPARSYRMRAHDRGRIALDHPQLMREWLVDVRAGDPIRPPRRRPPQPRTAE